MLVTAGRVQQPAGPLPAGGWVQARGQRGAVHGKQARRNIFSKNLRFWIRKLFVLYHSLFPIVFLGCPGVIRDDFQKKMSYSVTLSLLPLTPTLLRLKVTYLIVMTIWFI